MTHYLELKYSTSKARDTYGWNVITLLHGKKKYRTCGGGYDMIGTVFADWLQANYMDKIIEKLKPRDYDLPLSEMEYYGFFKRGDKYWLDGGCGIESMKRIAKAIGLQVQTLYNRQTNGFIVTEANND